MGDMPTQLLSVAEARRRLLEHFPPLKRIEIPLLEAANRVLASDVKSSLALPPFPNSSMDGFAVRAADVRGASPGRPVRLDVVVDIPAGQAVDSGVGKGQAARIMTGAVVPEGADAVVPVENTDFNQRQPGIPAPEQVQIYQPAAVGENVRPKGQDVSTGELVMRAGSRLRPQDLGFLSMLGVAMVPVYAKPRVAIFSTGDELVDVDQPLEPGKIHDANTATLLALVSETGAVPVNLGIVRDREEEVSECLERAARLGVDLILSSAGVSVGAFDFVRTVVEKQGSLDFWRVNMRPGKPLAFGAYHRIPFIGLPGNPVSAFVGFEVFVRPALLKMSGLESIVRSSLPAALLEPVESDGRESYLRAIVERQDERLAARLTGHQGSGNLRSLVQANALLIIPAGVKSLPAGAEVQAWLLGDV